MALVDNEALGLIEGQAEAGAGGGVSAVSHGDFRSVCRLRY